MKRFFFISLIISIVFISRPVSADYNQALSSYNFQYSQYRDAYSKFIVARSAYLSYRTLTAQNNAVSAFKEVLTARNDLVSSYLDLLQEKLNDTPEIDPFDLEAYSNTRRATKDWLTVNQNRIAGASSLEDLNLVSSEFTDRYPQTLRVTKQGIGRILLAKGTHLDKNLAAQFSQFQENIKRIASSGEDVGSFERGLIQARIKRDLFVEKQDLLRLHFFPQDSYYSENIDLLKGQGIALEANQYLREAASFLAEMVRNITG